MSDSPVRAWLDRDGALLRVRLARPKANIVDAAMIGALREAFAAHRATPGLRGALLDAEGTHFSFGASVEEHLPAACPAMLASLHALVREMLDWPLPLLAAVRGQCLGGGLEIVLAANLVFVQSDAQLGQPEIKLGVFAPAASCLLPVRIGAAAAEELLLSGRAMTAIEAVSRGLALGVSDDAEAAALAWFDQHLAPRSGAALACAVAAARGAYLPEVRRRLDEVERLYLDRLMTTRDAVEGLQAFIARRAPAWEHR